MTSVHNKSPHKQVLLPNLFVTSGTDSRIKRQFLAASYLSEPTCDDAVL